MYAVSRIVAPLACVARGVAVRPVVARCFASKPTLLTDDERKTLLPDLNEWSMVEGGRDAICKQYLFDDFKKAFAFMTRVAEYADEVDHHPEWFNVYNRVEVTLSTHDCGGLSQNDVDLARVMDNAAEFVAGK